MALRRAYQVEFLRVIPQVMASLAAVALFTTLFAQAAFAQIARAGQQNATATALSRNRAVFNSSDPSLFSPVKILNSGGNYSESLAAADLNGNGKLDVVVGNAGSNTVTVFLGDGTGKLGTPTTYGISAIEPTSVAVADLNGDGKPDIALAGYAYNGCGVAVLLGNGDGTFQPASEFLCASGAIDAYSVAIADLNGDGKLDLAVSTYKQINILLGNGDGTFQSAVTYSWGTGDGTSWGDRSLAVADVNRDGKPDIVVATGSAVYYEPGQVAVLLGNGDGTFQPAVDFATGTPYAWSLALADFNGDGKLDVVVANAANYDGAVSSIAVLLGNGDGTFQAATTYRVQSNLQSPRGIAAKDVNGDGIPDIIASDYCDDSACSFADVEVLLGNGDGTFQSPLLFSAGGDYAFGLVIGDLNGDGKPDVVVADATCYGVDCGHGWIGVLLNSSLTPTKTTLTSSLNPSVVGQAVTFTASVASSKGVPPNGETITFYNGTTVLGTAPLSGGAAALITSTLPAGIFMITASYPGDSNFAASVSPAVRQVVNSTTKSATTTTLASSLNPSIYGQKVTLTAAVTTVGPLPPTGTVVFTWQNSTETFTIGTASLNSSGIAILTRSNLNADLYPLTAVYKGDANNLGSTSPVLNQTVTQATSAATISSSLNPSNVGQAVTFTAKITSPTVTPTGPVTFTAGTTVLGTVQLNGGIATYTTSSLPAGSAVVKVTYAGDSNIKGSSAKITQVVQP